jgi:hypothetical protein
MERIVMRPIGAWLQTACWHCSQPVDRESGVLAARYIYRGDQALTVVVEDWIACSCGAFQNVRCLNEITIETLGKP